MVFSRHFVVVLCLIWAASVFAGENESGNKEYSRIRKSSSCIGGVLALRHLGSFESSSTESAEDEKSIRIRDREATLSDFQDFRTHTIKRSRVLPVFSTINTDSESALKYPLEKSIVAGRIKLLERQYLSADEAKSEFMIGRTIRGRDAIARLFKSWKDETLNYEERTRSFGFRDADLGSVLSKMNNNIQRLIITPGMYAITLYGVPLFLRFAMKHPQLYAWPPTWAVFWIGLVETPSHFYHSLKGKWDSDAYRRFEIGEKFLNSPEKDNWAYLSLERKLDRNLSNQAWKIGSVSESELSEQEERDMGILIKRIFNRTNRFQLDILLRKDQDSGEPIANLMIRMNFQDPTPPPPPPPPREPKIQTNRILTVEASH